MDYYIILEIDKTATKDEIKKSYRKLAMKYHPDRTKGDKESEEKFKKINEAYQVLSDDTKRKQYDMFGST
jgi:DnaJ-class molecular chaperone